MRLVDLIVKKGEQAVDSLPEGIRNNHQLIAETMENNVRRLIIDEMPVNPRYYEQMSVLLDALIRDRRSESIEYRKYLERIANLTRNIVNLEPSSPYPEGITTSAHRALFDNLGGKGASTIGDTGPGYGDDASSADRAALAVQLDKVIRNVKKADWRGNRFKERELRNEIKAVLGDDDQLVEEIFKIVKAQHDY